MKPARRRNAFTLIEMITAVAIIATLAAILFMGFSYVQRKAKRDQTNVALQTLRNMLTEYEVKGGDMQRMDELLGSTKDSRQPAAAIASPGQVKEGQSGREGTAVVNTRKVMRRLLAIPENQKLLAQLPDSQAPAAGEDPTKVKSDLVWRTTAADGKPEIVLLDGWGNPIVFVPRSGMTGVTQAGNTIKVTTPDARDVEIVVMPSGTKQTFFVGSAFFASAGEDGDFSNGDDNEYSFK